MLSTYAGMRIPGQNAAFLGFKIAFNDSLLTDNLAWKGEVILKSESTSSISQDLSLEDDSGKIYATAQINCKVQRKSPIMKSAKEIFNAINDNNLGGKVAIVTGGARGLGETISKILAAKGMLVIINYNSSEKAAQAVANEIIAAGGKAFPFKADLAEKNQVEELVNYTIKDFGRVDVLINNAVKDALATPFLEQEWIDVQAEIDVSLKGSFLLSKAVIPFMKTQGGGSIVNISTTYTDAPPAMMYKYVLVKNAMLGMTRSLAVEFAPFNIRVNSVSPSIMETDLTQNVPQDYLENSKALNPSKRNATPLEVAKAVLFLASDMSSFTTGQRIVVSGGSHPLL